MVRRPGLDLLRVTAALMVVVQHADLFGANLGPLARGANSGVFIFFALSGYLLYRPLVAGGTDLRAYVVKRLGRIMPGYWLAVVGLTILTGNVVAVAHPLAYATITQTFDPALFQGFVAPAWTLTVEMCFYAVLPVIAWAIRGRELRVLPWVWMLSWLAGWPLMVEGFMNGPLRTALPFMLFGFVPGMLVAAVQVRRPAVFASLSRRRWLLIGIGWMLIGNFPGFNHWNPFTSIGAALAIPWLAEHPLPFPRFLAFAGGASYALYLWHFDLMKTFGIVPGVVLALVIAGASWAFIERPVLAWSHHFARRFTPQAQSRAEPLLAGQL